MSIKESDLNYFLQRNIVFVLENKIIKEGKLFLYNEKDYYIQRNDYEACLIMYCLYCSKDDKKKLIDNLRRTTNDKDLNEYKERLVNKLESQYSFVSFISFMLPIELIFAVVFIVVSYVPILLYIASMLLYNAFTNAQNETSMDNPGPSLSR